VRIDVLSQLKNPDLIGNRIRDVGVPQPTSSLSAPDSLVLTGEGVEAWLHVS
jgi:hypothetical protein